MSPELGIRLWRGCWQFMAAKKAEDFTKQWLRSPKERPHLDFETCSVFAG
jgi:hypothetical protein